ncbi:hypothetical protein NC796_07820 [Aliifodinibius sp. S!AR15-10]|uniref:EamA family transporter n=1 Tax=Aliifodinibius sp. S!AR15-10 TaxID=2950437 RepID=UPI00285B3B82|nr:hypothetical protein [Aliifodinibius sp. S!AR15-10]MDR8391040.1 hypothetical protein [Aliifodinibius sp. S!AR15-10]
MSYFYLLASAACSLILVHLMKEGEHRKLRMLNTFTINYLVAAIVAFGLGGFPSFSIEATGFTNPAFIFAAVTGAVFIGNFLVYSKSIHLNGMGVSVAAMRLSLLLPVLLSVWLYGERVTTNKLLGLLSVFTALGLLIPKKQNIRFRKIDAAWLLLIIFLLTGLADSSLKIYEEDFSMQFSELSFMGLVFSCAFIIGLICSMFGQGNLVTRREVFMGCLIGIPNLYSAVFLIYALREIDGSVAYPIVNILNVVGGTLIGLWIWGDRVSKLQWLGITVAVAAILLLV